MASKSVSLQCPAQASPLPSFRLVLSNVKSNSSQHSGYLENRGTWVNIFLQIVRTCGRHKTKVFRRCQFQRNCTWHSKISNIDLPSSELPYPSIQVSFDPKTKRNFLEPIGGSKPQFSEDSNLKRISRVETEAMALLCPAQGYPQPAFRSIIKPSNFMQSIFDGSSTVYIECQNATSATHSLCIYYGSLESQHSG